MKDGARILLEHKSYAAAADLASLLIVSYNEQEESPTDEQISTVLSLFKFPVEEKTPACTYMRAAITWTSKKVLVVFFSYRSPYRESTLKCSL